MLSIDATGMVINTRIKRALRPQIERGDTKSIHGIVVHQTGAPTSQSTLDSYKRPSANGTHFLIDTDGTIYQTASLRKQTWHVGKLKARCVLEKRCTPVELTQLQRFNPSGENRREMGKSVPGRFPSNEDSIGIELVGDALPHGNKVPEQKKIYQPVTTKQNASLKWLASELASTLKVPMTEIFCHPDISRKNPTEAGTAKW